MEKCDHGPDSPGCFYCGSKKRAVSESPSVTGSVASSLIADALKSNRSKQSRACKLLTAYNVDPVGFIKTLKAYAANEEDRQ